MQRVLDTCRLCVSSLRVISACRLCVSSPCSRLRVLVCPGAFQQRFSGVLAARLLSSCELHVRGRGDAAA